MTTTPGENYLARCAETLRGAPPGGRNDEAFKTAAIVGSFVAGGSIDHGLAARELAAAAVAAGLPEREAAHVIARGLREGGATPKQLDAGSNGTRRQAKSRHARPALKLTPPPTEAPKYPHPQALADLLSRCVPVTKEIGVRRYLSEQRGLDPEVIADGGLALALPRESVSLPQWGGYGRRSWAESGHRLIVPLVDSQGEVRSVIARRVSVSRGDVPKSVSPKNYERRGLVMTCPRGGQMLRTGAAPEGSLPLRVVICEGEMDLLAWHISTARTDHPPAIIGMFSGGWSDEIAARIPHGSIVIVATDHDEAGTKYAEKIVRSLPLSMEVRRWRP